MKREKKNIESILVSYSDLNKKLYVHQKLIKRIKGCRKKVITGAYY